MGLASWIRYDELQLFGLFRITKCLDFILYKQAIRGLVLSVLDFSPKCGCLQQLDLLV